ncbi:Mediator of RNA polymerase II transcription subunit 6 [Lobulomyces angularis]|nr:Mediator of RNA polymerase II transcription subunit 6 [Lobulomyces angularis]
MSKQNEEELLNVCFKDTNFLQMYSLNEFNVLDYFSYSQFYEKSSLNEQIKMQARFNELQANMLDRRAMTGVEYDLWYHHITPNSSFFVIRKQIRHSPTKVDLMGLYYIINGTIYQSPDLFLLLSNRVLTSLHYVEKAFADIQAECNFHPTKGYVWKNIEELEMKNYDELLKKIMGTKNEIEEELDSKEDCMISNGKELDVSSVTSTSRSESEEIFLVTSEEKAKDAKDFAFTVNQLITRSNEFASEFELNKLKKEEYAEKKKMQEIKPTEAFSNKETLTLETLYGKDSKAKTKGTKRKTSNISGSTTSKKKKDANILSITNSSFSTEK